MNRGQFWYIIGKTYSIRNSFIRYLFIGDFLAHLAVFLFFVFASQLFPSLTAPEFSIPGPHLLGWIIVSFIWFLTLYFSNGYTEKIKLSGPAEYGLLFKTSIRAMGLCAIVSLYTQQFDVLTFIICFYFSTAVATILARWITRRLLSKARSINQFTSDTLIAGSVTSIVEICSILKSNNDHGYNIIGACIPYSRVQIPFHEVRCRAIAYNFAKTTLAWTCR